MMYFGFDVFWLIEVVCLCEEQVGLLEDSEVFCQVLVQGGFLLCCIFICVYWLGCCEGLFDVQWIWCQGLWLVLVLLLVLVLVSGVGLVFVVFGDGQCLVNVFWVLVSLFGLYLLILFGWVFGLFVGGEVVGVFGWFWLWFSGKLVCDVCVVYLVLVLLVLFGWCWLVCWGFGVLVYGFWLFGLLIVLVMFFGLLVICCYGFVWEIIIFGSDIFIVFIQVFGVLLVLFGFLLLDVELICVSGDVVLVSEVVWYVWVGWLVGVLLVYGVLLCVLFGLFCLWCWKCGLVYFDLDFDDLGYSLLCECLMLVSECFGVSDVVLDWLLELQGGQFSQEVVGVVLVVVELDDCWFWLLKFVEGVVDVGIFDDGQQCCCLFE